MFVVRVLYQTRLCKYFLPVRGLSSYSLDVASRNSSYILL